MPFYDMSKYNIAVAMVRYKAKISAVHQETGIPKRALRAMYQSIHGESTVQGQPKKSLLGIRDRRERKEAIFFAVCYKAQSRSAFLDKATTIIKAYDSYKNIRNDSPGIIDFSTAWVVAHDLISGAAQTGVCQKCGAATLSISTESSLIDSIRYKSDVCAVCGDLVAENKKRKPNHRKKDGAACGGEGDGLRPIC